MVNWKSYSFFITHNYHWIEHHAIINEKRRIFSLLQGKTKETLGSNREGQQLHCGFRFGSVCFETNKAGRPHTHWYIRFKNARSFKSIQKLFPSANIQKRKGTEQDCINYIRKGGIFEEIGEPARQGCRTDLRNLSEDILGGRITCEEILSTEAHTYHVYGRTLEKIEDTFKRNQKRTVPTKGLWLYGSTGVGKSSRCFNEYPDAYWKSVGGKEFDWWDGYRGERVVVIDEFRGEIAFSFLLRLMDRYPLGVSRRCREPYPFTSTLIVITSRYHPRHVYKDQSAEEMKQLYRRCDIIKLMKDSIKCENGVPIYANRPEDREQIIIDSDKKIFRFND